MILNPLLRNAYTLVSPGGKAGKLQIFIFHRVLDEPDLLMPGEPDIVYFEKIAHLLSKIYNVISLSDAVDRLNQGSLPPRAACITFDDGYKDNFTIAYPILKRYGLPATIFIATDYLGNGMMWNDIIIESIRFYDGSVSINELDIIDKPCHTLVQKRELIKTIIGNVKYSKLLDRQKFAEKLESELGYKREALMMSKGDIKELSGDLITIGAHTQSHPILSKTTEAESREQIGNSKEILESLLGEKVDFFAYPNGQPEIDYDKKDVDIVKSLGFKSAVSTRKNIATYSDNLYELPRFTPWDKNILKFMMRNLKEAYSV